MNNENNLIVLTNDEHALFCTIFKIGVSNFLSDVDFAKDIVVDNSYSFLLQEYKNNRINTIKEIAKKFEIDIDL